MEKRTDSFRVIDIGAGPRGLFLAHTLTLENIDYVILGRHPNLLSDYGQIIFTRRQSVRLLDQIGLFEKAQKVAIPLHAKKRIYGVSGEVLTTSRLWKDMEGKYTGMFASSTVDIGLASQSDSGRSAAPKATPSEAGSTSPDGSRSGAINAYGGYFLQEDVRNFDNSFFEINNIEATYMDPQQRKLLEVIFECFEDAGATLEGMSGSCTSVYVGNFTVD
ncbi:uncharacterized protein BDV14DRAFT_196951 [Aspergillus stella-maris]|uniref:uncharacterized protein n=1 Tax=Aspergillus stella-maris TaxID=1810926 RepID=UPI003CCE4723